MIRGKALVLGDDVNTDELHPSSFYSLDDTKVRQGFLRAVEGREGDAEKDLSGSIVVAGRNFGIGSSRETGARAAWQPPRASAGSRAFTPWRVRSAW